MIQIYLYFLALIYYMVDPINIGILIARLITGILFIVHGYSKVTNLKSTANFVESIGFRPGAFWGVLLTIAEFGGGLLLTVGLLTKYAAAALIPVMAVAVWYNKVKMKKPFKHGYELDLILIAILILFIIIGAGTISIDTLYQAI